MREDAGNRHGAAALSGRVEPLAAAIERVARQLLGEPNRRLSRRGELRFGSRGSLSVVPSRGVWHDHAAGEGGGTLDLIARETGRRGADAIAWLRDNLDSGTLPDRPAAVPVARPAPHQSALGNRARALAVWRETLPPAGTWTDLWLRDRGIRFATPAPVRHHPALPYWHGREMIGRFPAMVVRMDDPAGAFAGIHRTWLSDAITPDAIGKADVPTPRMTLGPLGCAWLGPRTSQAIIAGEGVETVLAASEPGGNLLPAWGCTPVACICAAGLSRFDPPATVLRLWIAEDNDPAGQAATAKLAERAHARGIAVTILRGIPALTLIRCRVAAVLAAWDGRTTVTPDDWALTGILADTSRAVRSWTIAAADEQRAEIEAADAERRGRCAQTMRAMSATADEAVQWLAQRIAGRVQRNGKVTRRDLNRNCTKGKDRHLLQAAIDHAEAAGWIVAAGDDGYHPGPSRPAA